MPHCLIDCPVTLAQRGEQTLLATVHDALDAFGVFKPGDIKVRLNGFVHYRCGSTQMISSMWPYTCLPGAVPNSNAAWLRRCWPHWWACCQTSKPCPWM
ncbi:hypothetical protein [Pseudomonas wuhanensis]|uniref:Uncharacterized protein n=1 Tax=Pseudomonas wuhanensis TaxID=2954098 RepID=A0ABY9GYQ8_9PSED|nr:hypothetical protein [Pseudomonas sp. FP607]WLI20941.1 hypothetical protein PSH88_13245 [Pseudomonas sp. FP607]